MFRIRQSFAPCPPLDARAGVEAGVKSIGLGELVRGRKIAVAVGSRGITNLAAIVAALVEALKASGSQPFIVPAMGSHGGSTPEGQTELLAGYGITEQNLRVPVHASMEVEQLGTTADGAPVYFSKEALRADGVIVVNRVKPHTDFQGTLGSGIMKMIAIGLGKRTGATACHALASRLGHERVIRTVAQVSLRHAPILCGVAILEGPSHETARIEFLKREDIETREGQLLIEAKKLMPRLPFDDIDLLIIDRMGKNISGAGIDPNITGRQVDGYLSSLMDSTDQRPVVRRLFVRDLTPESHGNAVGIGLADLTTSRLVRAIDPRVTYINALTALTPNTAKIPIHFESDREAIAQGLTSLAQPETTRPKVVRIADTLNLSRVEVSDSYSDLLPQRKDLSSMGEPVEMQFDSSGNLSPLALD